MSCGTILNANLSPLFFSVHVMEMVLWLSLWAQSLMICSFQSQFAVFMLFNAFLN